MVFLIPYARALSFKGVCGFLILLFLITVLKVNSSFKIDAQTIDLFTSQTAPALSPFFDADAVDVFCNITPNKFDLICYCCGYSCILLLCYLSQQVAFLNKLLLYKI